MQQVDHPRLAALLDFWQRKRLGRDIPLRQSFVAEELGPWMSHLAMLRVEPASERPRFFVQVNGEALIGLLGGDTVGHYVDDILPRRLREVLLAPYYAAVRRRRPVYFVSRSNHPDTDHALFRLILPLASAEDDRVEKLMFGLYSAHEATTYRMIMRNYDPVRIKQLYRAANYDVVHDYHVIEA